MSAEPFSYKSVVSLPNMDHEEKPLIHFLRVVCTGRDIQHVLGKDILIALPIGACFYITGGVTQLFMHLHVGFEVVDALCNKAFFSADALYIILC